MQTKETRKPATLADAKQRYDAIKAGKIDLDTLSQYEQLVFSKGLIYEYRSLSARRPDADPKDQDLLRRLFD